MFIIFISRKICLFQKYIIESIICNITFPHKLGAKKSEIRAGLGTPGSNFIASQVKKIIVYSLSYMDGSLWKLHIKFVRNFVPPPNSTHTWSINSSYVFRTYYSRCYYSSTRENTFDKVISLVFQIKYED